MARDGPIAQYPGFWNIERRIGEMTFLKIRIQGPRAEVFLGQQGAFCAALSVKSGAREQTEERD